MRAHPDDSLFHTSSIVSTWVRGCFIYLFIFLCRGAVVFVPVLPLRFLNTAYQLTMATDRSLLILAGLISRWCDSTLSVYDYKPENNKASVIPSKGTRSVNIMFMFSVRDLLSHHHIDQYFYFTLPTSGLLCSLTVVIYYFVGLFFCFWCWFPVMNPSDVRSDNQCSFVDFGASHPCCNIFLIILNGIRA